MFARIAIFELRMYFVPGAFMVMAGAVLGRILFGPNVLAFPQVGDLTESFAFVFGSYIAGHFIQAVAHGVNILGFRFKPEEFLKRAFWNGCYPSEIMLFKGLGLINEITRARVIKALEGHGTLRSEDAKHLEGAISDEGKQAAQAAFFDILGRYADKEDSGVKTSESYYQMFRGLSLVSAATFFWSLAVSIVIALSYSGLALNLPTPWSPAGVFVSPVVTFVMWSVFRHRCRGAGEGFARQVFQSVLSNP